VDVSAGRLAAIASHGAELTLDASALDFRTIKQQIAASARAWGCAS
jgi:hypothetical protein